MNNDPRQSQNWHSARAEPARQPLAIREPPKPSRFGSWTENRSSRDTPRPAAAPNYADFIYERSVSSKSDIYSDNDTASTTTFTPSSTFSPALSGASTLTSMPSEVPCQSPTSSASTITASSPRHPFPLHIPALARAQSAIRGLFTPLNQDIRRSNPPPAPVPAAPMSHTADLPASSPPRSRPLPPEASTRPTSPNHGILSESPQPISSMPSDYFPPPPSESEVSEAHRLALLNAQHNSASSAYYQAGLRVEDHGNGIRAREQSPERAAQMGSSSRSVASSSFPAGSMDLQGRIVYESSSLGVTSPTSVDVTADFAPRPFPTASQPQVAHLSSESSSITAVEPEPRLRDSRALNAQNVPVSQLVQLDSPNPRDRERAERTRVMSDLGRYEDLRGLTILSERQREAYSNAFAPGTQSRSANQLFEVPSVVRSDSNDSRPSPVPERARKVSGNMRSSLPQLPDRRSPPQVPTRPASTPPLPRIDTTVAALLPTPERGPTAGNVSLQQQQSPSRRDVPATPMQPLTAPPINTSRSRTAVAGPRLLPVEPQRRRSDGDQPMSSGLFKRTSAIFHRSSSPENSAPRETPAPRPSRPGTLPLDPQRRRSDGFQSVAPARAPTPVQGAPGSRNVRWNETLVCPSPIFASQRRKGWFNRRG